MQNHWPLIRPWKCRPSLSCSDPGVVVDTWLTLELELRDLYKARTVGGGLWISASEPDIHVCCERCLYTAMDNLVHSIHVWDS